MKMILFKLLNKNNFNGILNYSWLPKNNVSVRLDLINIQYVQNLNVANYFNVYASSYDTLNVLGQTYSTNPSYFENGNLTHTGALLFIEDVINDATILTSLSSFFKENSMIN